MFGFVHLSGCQFELSAELLAEVVTELSRRLGGEDPPPTPTRKKQRSVRVSELLFTPVLMPIKLVEVGQHQSWKDIHNTICNDPLSGPRTRIYSGAACRERVPRSIKS